MAQNDAYSVLNLLSVISNRYQIDRKELGCPKMRKSWKCHAPTAKSDAKTLIFWENIKIWAQN